MDDAQIEAKTMWEPNSGCLIWLGSINHNGYGQIGINYNNHLAHRVIYSAKKGQIPAGACVLHRCDNRLCVNPNHLFLGTRQDNTADMMNKGRNKYVCHTGENNGFARLTAEQIIEIRNAPGLQKEIGERYGIGQSHVSQIKRRVVWGHL